MKKGYIVGVAGVALAAVFFMQFNSLQEAVAFQKALDTAVQEGVAKLDKDTAEKEGAKIEGAEKKEKEAQPAQEKPAGLSAVDEKAAANPAGGQTSQGVADLPEPGNNKGGSSAAGASTEGDSGAAMQKFYNDILDAEDKEAGNPAGGQTSQGAADLPEPGNNESNMSTAETGLEEEDQNSKELENPAENEIDIGADFEKSDNQSNENPQQQSLE